MNRQELLNQIKAEIGKPTKRVTVAELSLKLKQIDGSQATNVVIIGETDVRMNKGGRNGGNTLFDRLVRKVTRYEAMINFNYTNAVNNQLEREDKERDFEAQKNWHQSKYDDFNGCVKMHVSGKGEYLAYKELNTHKYATLVDGVEATAEDMAMIELYKKPYSAPKNQGTEVAVDYRCMMLTNILFLKAKGEVYEIIQEELK